MLDSALTPSRFRDLSAAVISIILLLLFYKLIFRQQASLPLPPGPPGRFLVGNFGQVNLDRPEEDYIRWGKEYSECRFGGRDLVLG